MSMDGNKKIRDDEYRGTNQNYNIKINSNYKEGDTEEEFQNINLENNCLVQRETRKILASLQPNNLTPENIFKLKQFLIQLTQDELKLICVDILKVIPGVHKYIFSNFENGQLYSVFNNYRDLLIEIRKNDNINSILLFKEKELDKFIDMLDKAMKDIIEKQMKMKKTRKNLKEKLRLQRKLQEARNKH